MQPPAPSAGDAPMPHRFPLLALFSVTAMSSFARADDFEDRVRDAQAALKAGNADEALKAATKAVELGADKPAGYLLRGQALGMQRKHEEAIKDFDKVIQLNPKSAA